LEYNPKLSKHHWGLAGKAPRLNDPKKGKVMEKRMLRIGGIFGLILVMVSMMVIGCSREQAPPPMAAPPAPAPSTAVAPQPSAAPPAGTAALPAAQIQIGMPSAQVQQIMGAPSETKQKGAITEWKYLTPQGKVEVQIQGNQVVGIERH
jgi:hypothetical protein